MSNKPITLAELRKKHSDLPRLSKRKSTFNASKKSVDGIKFDSQAEADYYLELKELLKEGKIKDLHVHPRVQMLPNLFWNLDFMYREVGDRRIFVDVKGMRVAPDAQIKIDVWGDIMPEFLEVVYREPTSGEFYKKETKIGQPIQKLRKYQKVVHSGQKIDLS